MSEPDEYLNIEQAARFLNVSETSLRRWTNSGQLACLRVGRRRERRFRPRDLLAFMEEQPAGSVTRREEPGLSAQSMVTEGPRMAHGTHVCGLYGSNPGRANLAAAFLADGFYPGSVSYLVATPQVRKAILTRLERIRPSLAADIEAGRLVLTDHQASAQAQWNYFEKQFPKAMRAGAQSLRVVGDMWGLGRVVPPEALVEFEAGYDERIARRFPVVSLCQYDARRFSSLAILAALQGHRDTFRYPIERLLG
jgi:excisionase family DNA binding protein